MRFLARKGPQTYNLSHTQHPQQLSRGLGSDIRFFRRSRHGLGTYDLSRAGRSLGIWFEILAALDITQLSPTQTINTPTYDPSLHQ